jgi:hypothetical protein
MENVHWRSEIERCDLLDERKRTVRVFSGRFQCDERPGESEGWPLVGGG